MKDYEGNANILIADVDCTAGGQSLCNEIGVRGYPSIKYGDPSDLQDYKGGRSADDIKKHAETLGPTCSPANLDLCDDEKKAQINKFSALGSEERQKMIQEKDAEMKQLEDDFTKMVEQLNADYKASDEKKEQGIKAIKDAGLGLLKAVHKDASKDAKSEL